MGRLNNKWSMVVCWLAFGGGLLTIFFVAIPGYQKSHRLLTTGLPAVAHIVGAGQQSKTRYLYADYTYQVGGLNYQGKDRFFTGSPEDRGALNIRYLPDDPGYSQASPEKAASDATVALWASCGFTVLFGCLGAYYYRSVRKRSGW